MAIGTGWLKWPPKGIATSSGARPPGATPLSLVDNIKFISLKILVILMRSSTILFILGPACPLFSRPSLPYFGHSDVRHGQKYQAIINDLIHCHLSCSLACRHGALASCSHPLMLDPPLCPLLASFHIFLVGCCVCHWRPSKSMIILFNI